MENQQVLDIISNLKGRRNYEEKKSKKLGFSSLYEYFEDKLQKFEELDNKKNEALKENTVKKSDLNKNNENKVKSCGCC
tara:strand:- start:1731 stop:1967 length:237 start_codon:yes stop_codon:yes gene_type:complete